MPRGSKPGERRDGRQKGTPNRKTALKNALFNAAASSPNTSPLDFMLGLMGDPKVPTDLRLDMAVAAAPFVHAKPQAPPRVRTNPMDSSPIKGVPDSIEPNSDAASPKQDTRRPKMEAELKGPELALGNGLSENGAGDNGVDSTPLQIMLGVTNVAGAAATQRNPMDSNPVKGVPGSKTEEELKAPELARADGLSENGAGDNGVDLTPLQFMLSVMQDADATPKLRIKAARVAARYKHAAVPSDKLAAVDEYGFAISRTLANAIKEDWLALKALGFSSKEAPRRAEILARQTKREELLRCPAGYSPESDQERLGELKPHWPPRKLGMAEETELAFVIARITAFEAAFNRTPEGQIRRRMADLKSRRETANRERNRRSGLTRVEGKELDELLKQYKPESPNPPPSYLKLLCDAVGDSELLVERFQRDRELRRQQASVGSDPDSEMEELAPTSEELREWEAEQIARRIAAGDPDPWDGKAPDHRIHELEMRRVSDKELTPAEENELQLITRLYPEPAEKIRKTLARRHSGTKMGQKMYGPSRPDRAS
jgi:hypothetical protein